MRVILRTKGGHKQGMGDIMGSLALADAFQDRGVETLFIVDDGKEALRCIKDHGYRVIPTKNDGEETSYLKFFSPHVILVNQLNNPRRYLENLKKNTLLLVTVNDAGEGAQVADIRFNPLYRTPRAFCGPEFAPLKREFQKTSKRHVRKKVENILITLGGSDTYGFTPKVVSALRSIPKEVSITVLLGPAFKHKKELERVLSNVNRPFTIVRNAKNMADLIAGADIAVCSGGNTLFEVACMGTPAVVVCCEPFEEETAMMMKKKGFGISLGFGKSLEEKCIFKAVNDLMENYELRLHMSKNGKKLVDGKGAKRSVEIIIKKMEEVLWVRVA